MLRSWLTKLELRIIDISARQRRAGFFSLETVLVLMSLLYKMGTSLRVGLYDRGLLKRHRISCPMISFGNIVAGGSGKTPMVMYAGSFLSSMGFKVVVITRGYGGTAGKKGAVAGDGTHCLLGPGAGGDEPCMMVRKRQYPVVVDRNRVRGARRAMAQFAPDVMVLDDAFQHLRIHRDLDMVLMDAMAPLGNGKLIPAGRLRESSHAVGKRADGVIYTRCTPGKRPAEGSWSRGKPVFLTQHVPFLCDVIQQGQPLSAKALSLDWLNGRTAVIFSAIADNDGFCRSVERCGVRVLEHICFRDHHRFDAGEISHILHRAGVMRASLLITTEKDYARLGFPENWPVDLAVMGVKIEFIEGEDRFKSLLLSCVDRG